MRRHIGFRGILLSAFLGALLTGQARAATMFIANDNGGSINEYNLDGTPVGSGVLVSGLNHPSDIALSGSDLFVTLQSTGVVGEYTTSGATVNASFLSGLSGPTGIAVSGSNLFITNPGAGTIGEYTTSGGP